MFDFYGKNVYKLGCTQNMKNRLGNYCTSSIDPYEIKYKSPVLKNKQLAEKILFAKLSNYRLTKIREFFKCGLEIIKQEIDDVTKLFKHLSDDQLESIVLENKNKSIEKYIIDADNITDAEYKKLTNTPYITFGESCSVEKYKYSVIFKQNINDIDQKFMDKFFEKCSVKKDKKINNHSSENSVIMCRHAKILGGDKHIYVKNENNYKLYSFNGNQWEQDITLFKQFISTDLFDFMNMIYSNDFCFDNITHQIKKLKTAKFKSEMVETYKEINTRDDIKFDSKWNLLGFKNLVYDLESAEFRKYKYEDCISTTTGYNWEEPSVTDVAFIEKLIKQIMPIDEERELYLQILATTLDGKCLEKFIIFNGSGGNGKGMIDDLLLRALGNYAMIGNNSILFETSKTGSNPEKANIHKKRFVLFREPPESKRFENSIIKELTGGGTFSARGHHESNAMKELNLTMIVEANKRPLFAEEPTDADSRRIIDIFFRATYTQNESLVDEENHVYLANSYYKTQEFQEKYKFALLKVLMDSYEKFRKNNYILKLPKTIDDRTKQYLEMSCGILQWFKDNYEHTGDKNDICKMKDLYDDFSHGIYFINLTKVEKRKYNKSYFSDFVSTNPFFSKYHKKCHKNVKNCLVEWVAIKGDD